MSSIKNQSNYLSFISYILSLDKQIRTKSQDQDMEDESKKQQNRPTGKHSSGQKQKVISNTTQFTSSNHYKFDPFISKMPT